MVRFKNRYITLSVELPFEDETFTLKPASLSHAIVQTVQKLHGDFGVAAIRAGFVSKYCNESTRMAIIRVRHGPHRFITSAIPFVTKLGGRSATLNTIYVGATIRQCQKFIIKHHEEQLLKLNVNELTESDRADLKRKYDSLRNTTVSVHY